MPKKFCSHHSTIQTEPMKIFQFMKWMSSGEARLAPLSVTLDSAKWFLGRYKRTAPGVSQYPGTVKVPSIAQRFRGEKRAEAIGLIEQFYISLLKEALSRF